MRYLFAILILCSLWSCEYSAETTHIIENKTDHHIKIELFKKTGWKYDKTGKKIPIADLTNTIELTTKGDAWYVTHRENMTTEINVILALDSDSVVVTLDNLKQLIYTIGDGNDRSILSNRPYELVSEKEKKRTFLRTVKYTFTEADYEAAEEIN